LNAIHFWGLSLFGGRKRVRGLSAEFVEDGAPGVHGGLEVLQGALADDDLAAVPYALDPRRGVDHRTEGGGGGGAVAPQFREKAPERWSLF